MTASCSVGVAVGADDHVDARHGLGQAHVLAVGEASVLAFFHTAVAERDDHIHLLRLAEELHHLPGGLDGIGELNRAGAVGIELGFFAEQPDDAKANTAALDHDVAANHPILGQALETGQCCVIRREVGIRCDHRRNMAGLGGHRDGLGRAVRSEVEIMVAEGGGVATHPGQELQFAAGLAGGRGERGPHAVVARIKHQHWTLT